MSLTLNDNIVLTDLAYEKARLLGMSLITAKYNSPPAAPVRPYLSKEQNNKSLPLKPAGALPFFSGESISYSPNQVVYNTKPTAPIENLQPGLTPLAKTTSVADGFPPGYPVAFSGHKPDKNQIRQQIIEKVNLRYGKIDQNLLDKIIQRALSNAGIE
ncbi:MAG: hypothetical protein CL609_24830 [Anaerolineaceae bacterium]|nr:hypothetical protein [Anaerolineaceae bacterium]